MIAEATPTDNTLAYNAGTHVRSSCAWESDCYNSTITHARSAQPIHSACIYATVTAVCMRNLCMRIVCMHAHHMHAHRMLQVTGGGGGGGIGGGELAPFRRTAQWSAVYAVWSASMLSKLRAFWLQAPHARCPGCTNNNKSGCKHRMRGAPAAQIIIRVVASTACEVPRLHPFIRARSDGARLYMQHYIGTHHVYTWRMLRGLGCAMRWRTSDKRRLAAQHAWSLLRSRCIGVVFPHVGHSKAGGVHGGTERPTSAPACAESVYIGSTHAR